MSAHRLRQELSAAQHGTDGTQRLFALADAAQSPALPEALNALGKTECLFDVSEQSDLARQAPYLVELPAFDPAHSVWIWILRHGPKKPCVTVLHASTDFDALLQRLRALAGIRLPDGDEMFFAFWDPAILGALVGQADDSTLHVAGPVLTPAQRASLFDGLSGWWYWDRAGSLHGIEISSLSVAKASVPFMLSQAQVDDLVEGSVPDHICYYIELNQRQLFEGMASLQRYRFVQEALAAGRAVGLAGMGDLVNYTCASLIYRERMRTDPLIAALLGRVTRREISLDAAMKEFP